MSQNKSESVESLEEGDHYLKDFAKREKGNISNLKINPENCQIAFMGWPWEN